MHIRKLRVTKGVYWVEIPAANLRILCAAPEDTVKHLIRGGFINEIEEGGVTFETGPNAILLADSTTQHGTFCNLAEFPVLQMLYRQGMIIPNHPGNTGNKPLLIGSESQVRAQLNYIFRGNYGLVSEDELMDAGVPAEEARDYMRLKLKFAFGAIKPARDILDACVVEDTITQLRPDVFIQRVAHNVFEISHGGETVEVDLNLGADENYHPPYHLGYHALKREYFAVVHSGDGDGWDTDRPSMSSIVMFQGKIYLIDAGPNVANTLRALGISIAEVEGLFLTHAHDDHFAGVTTLMRADRPLKFFATAFVRASALKKLEALLSIDEDTFSHFFDFRDLTLNDWNDVEGLEVKPIFSPHPVETTCLLFRAIDQGGYKTYAHWADVVSEKVLSTMITDDETQPGLSRERFESVRQDYLTRADIKKIDIGGGMIHGEAADFANDPSEKIVLAHRSTPLTSNERTIGAGAPFGTIDVLIRGAQDYTYQRAARLLKAYFTGIEAHMLQAFLNGPVVEYNPESFIARAGVVIDSPILLLSGQVERLSPDRGGHAQMASGAIIGEFSALDGQALKDTYRAISFVTALHIPAAPFRRFAKDDDIISDIQELSLIRAFLQRTPIFNDNMSRRLLHDLVHDSRQVELNDGDAIDWGDDDRLYLIESGRVDLLMDDGVRESLGPLSVFGETCVLFGVAPVYKARANGATKLLALNAKSVSTIPVARWKLLSAYQSRIHSIIIDAALHEERFFWTTAFAIGVERMDQQHQNLFDKASHVLKGLAEGTARERIKADMDALLEATREHFASEEDLLAEIAFPTRNGHQRMHQDLIADIERVALRIDDRAEDCELPSASEFRSFFLTWIVFHILGEDRKYAKHYKELMAGAYDV